MMRREERRLEVVIWIWIVHHFCILFERSTSYTQILFGLVVFVADVGCLCHQRDKSAYTNSYSKLLWIIISSLISSVGRAHDS
jgi:hypothetical protein